MGIIEFEGIDGVGKTTHIKALSEFLTKMGVSNLVTQELYGDELRGQLKGILTSNQYGFDGYDELMLISLARRWHYRSVVKPALEQGVLVLIDRYVDSTWAYQGGGRGLPESVLTFFETKVWGVPKPDLVIYLKGLSHRQSKNDRFEEESEAFFKRISEWYGKRCNPSWRTFFAQQNFDLVQRGIQNEVLRFLGLI